MTIGEGIFWVGFFWFVAQLVWMSIRWDAGRRVPPDSVEKLRQDIKDGSIFDE
jgi:hypothetical protein